MPTTDLLISTIRVGIEEVAPGRTRLSIESVFLTTAAMGTDEGLRQAVGQIEDLLAADTIPR